MCRRLILSLIVVGVFVAVPGVASALPLIGTVDRSGGASDTGRPRNPDFNGEDEPLPMQEGGWIVGNYMFSDRDYTWASVSPEIEGAEYICTYNTDKGTSVTYTVTFPLGATVLLAIDDRFGDQQGYADEVTRDIAEAGTFTDTGWDAVTSEGTPRTLSIFSAAVEAGTYVFHAPSSGSNNFYVIGALAPPAPIRKAHSPVPADGSRTPPGGVEGDGYWMLMSFTAGEGATTHTAYFSSNFEDVESRNAAVSLGSPPYPGMFETGYYAGLNDPTLPEFARTPLERGVTYYWVVDESNGTASYPGDVWSFVIASEEAWGPNPADGAENVIGTPDLTLSWNLGDVPASGFNISYEVFFGTDEATVAAATTPDAVTTDTTHVVGPLAGDTAHFWRVDTLLTKTGPPFDTITHTGDVWEFSTLFSVGPAEPNLVAWWKLDGGFGDLAFDWSGNANHGTVKGGAQFVAGFIDNAIDLNGSNQYAEVPNSASLNMTKDFTIAAWIYPRDVMDDYGIVTKCEGTSHKQYVFTIVDGELRLEYEASGNNYNITGGTVTAGEWQHVAVTVDGSLLINLYVNGMVTASETADGEVQAQPNPVVIGRWSGTYNNRYFDGLIDDVKIYNKVVVPKGPEKATLPDPSNGAVDVPRTPTLSWNAGSSIQAINGNILYYGEDAAAVAGRTATSVTLTDAIYTLPLTLDLGATFYWAVDTVNGVETWPGDVWSFTTTNWLSVDDMETYTPWTTPGDNIFEAYRDGMGNCAAGNGNDTGANLTENQDEAFAFAGVQSMKYDYDNDGLVYNPCTMAQGTRLHKYSKIEAQVAGLPSGIGTNWTIQGVKALSLRFYGQASNAVEPMWVQLSDGTKAYGNKVTYGDYDDENPNAITEESWHEWFIDMADFGVDLTNVVSLVIGFGTEGSAVAGGAGTVYFDDFRLYTPGCRPSRHTEAMAKLDFAPVGAPDCVVDYQELDILASDWLKKDSTADGELLLRWKFDETAGTTAADSSGNGHDGDVNDMTGASWVNDLERGRCLDFDGGDNVLDDDADLYMNGLDAMTVCMWIKSNEIGTDAGFIIFEDPVGQDKKNIRYDSDGGEGDTNLIKYGVTVDPADGQGDGREEDESPSGLQTTSWQHIAMTWRSGVGLQLYVDGDLKTPEEDAAAYTGVTAGYEFVMVGRAGKFNDAGVGGWSGLIDDVQIYDYPLSASEVATVMGGGQIANHTVHYPPASPAELYEGEPEGSRIINFKDYAELMDGWLVEMKYPQ